MPAHQTDRDPGTRLLGGIQIALAAIALTMLLAVVPLALTGDGHERWEAVSDFLRTGHPREMRYSFIGPLFATPLILLDNWRTGLWWAMRFNVLVAAAGAAAAWWLLRGLVPAVARASFVLLLVAAGMMPNNVRDFYGEVFTAVFVATGLIIVIANGHWSGWIPVVLGVANTPPTAVGLAFVALWRLWRKRRVDGVIAAAAVAALVLAENAIVRGDLLAMGYTGDHGFRTVMPFSGRPGFSYPLLLGVVSLLFSFGKGLLFFAPGLLMIAQARRNASRPIVDVIDAWIVFLIGILLVYSRWWSWYGGWYWGPRFLLFAVYPSALALSIVLASPATKVRQTIAVLLTLWTVWVGASGIVFGLHGMDVCMANDYALEHLCWYTPEFSPLFRPLVIHSSLELWQRAWITLAAAIAGLLIVPHVWRAVDVVLPADKA